MIQFSCTSKVWKLCDRNWSLQCRVVVQALCINTIHTIRNCINLMRFHNSPTNLRNAITNIKANVQLVGTWTNIPFRNSLEDFRILKLFDVLIHPPRTSLIKFFLQVPPLDNWVKFNTNGATNNSSSACGGIFRSSSGDFIVGFLENLGKHNAFFAELSGALRAIEVAQLHH